MKDTETSWEKVSDWYEKAVGKEGSYYHQHTILPKSLRLLDLKPDSSLLDLACGQGVLARRLPPAVHYVGLDASPSLIHEARQLDKNRRHTYKVADITADLPVEKRDFTHATLILALQNIKNPEKVIRNASQHLRKDGKLLMVINHPYFRIPRQTRWGIDEANRIQYRRIDRYLTPISIPITTHPGKGASSEVTWSYHIPLSGYVRTLAENGFVIERLEEWISDKKSAGKAAKMENRAREEFPMFMAIVAKKD